MKTFTSNIFQNRIKTLRIGVFFTPNFPYRFCLLVMIEYYIEFNNRNSQPLA